MTSELKAARHEVGLPKFERECPVKEMDGKRMKAFRIPGTPEHGRWCSLSNRALEIAKRDGVHNPFFLQSELEA